MKMLITGFAGFIGFHAAREFLRRGWEVVGVDNFCDYYAVGLKRDRAAHLAGVFRWVNGDNGLDDLKLAAAVKPGDACLARDFTECGQGGRPSNQVWIWAEDGLCPIREEWEVHLPLFLIPYAGYFAKHAGMALPVLGERAYGATVWSAVAGGRPLPFAEIENVDHLVRTEYDVYMRGALAREITRVIVKVGLQVALGATAAMPSS